MLKCFKRKNKVPDKNLNDENDGKPRRTSTHLVVADETKVSIERSAFNYTKFTRQYPARLFTGFSVLALMSELYVKHFKPSKECATKQLRNRLSLIKMIKTYNIKEYLLADVISGATVDLEEIRRYRERERKKVKN